ncbi:hypothetical protein [Variovorax boronicumulans]|uniref:hypothetical protein n=1 Tax=Variovorax boronicumulans TaxID=436515 RepID=UPI0012FDE6CE|nr:hypothetical protein [Variovorax boronicumulans]
MRKGVYFVFAALVMSGCAARDPNLRTVQGESIQLAQKLMFSAIAGGGPDAVNYHALLPGKYTVKYEDLRYRYFLASGPLMVLGASKLPNGSIEEPLAYGGFCVAMAAETSPQTQLFYLPNQRINRVVIDGVVQDSVLNRPAGIGLPQAVVGAAIGGAIAEALIANGAVGSGGKNGQPIFVPKREVAAETEAILSAVKSQR